MLLAHEELKQIVSDGVIDALPENINGTSIDVRLGKTLLIEHAQPMYKSAVELDKGEAPMMQEVTIGNGYALNAGSFVLGHTVEKFNMPDDLSAEFRLRSTFGRAGLQHALAVWIDPGFHGCLTLELSNALKHHQLILKPGLVLGQVIFHHHEPVPEEQSYRVRGRYNGVEGVMGVNNG